MSVQAKCVLTWRRHWLRLVWRDWHRSHLPWKWTAKLYGATTLLPWSCTCLISVVCFGASKTNSLYYLVRPTYSFIPQHIKWNFSFQCEISTANVIATHSPSFCSFCPWDCQKNNSIICCKSRTEVYSCPLLLGLYISYCSIGRDPSRGFCKYKKAYKRFLCATFVLTAKEKLQFWFMKTGSRLHDPTNLIHQSWKTKLTSKVIQLTCL